MSSKRFHSSRWTNILIPIILILLVLGLLAVLVLTLFGSLGILSGYKFL